jgi:hypothetical protein
VGRERTDADADARAGTPTYAGRLVDEVACALLDRIAASTGDGDADDDRLVLADHLMQIGHRSWGELIMLSCDEARGPLTRELRHRLFLLRGDSKAWLGPVKAVTYRREIDRGLLVATGLDGRRRGMVAAAEGHPAWRTVRHVSLHEHARWAGHFRANDEIVELLRRLPALTELRGVTMDIVLALATADAAPLRVRALQLFLYKSATDALYREVNEILGGPAFETVRELALGWGIHRTDHRVEPEELGWWLGGAPIMRHVETLRLGILPELELLREALARRASRGLRACHAQSWAMSYAFERDAAGGWSRLTARLGDDPHTAAGIRIDRLERELATLAHGSLAAIEICVPAALRPGVERRVEQIATRQPDAAITVTEAAARP